MTTNNSSSSGGIGIFGLMGVMFIGLKIAGVINWPWVWVLAPFWGSIVLVVAVLLIAAVIVTIANK
jgi:hypothetical protein